MSTLKTKNVQIGDSTTAPDNYRIYQTLSADGTLRVATGNATDPEGSADVLIINGTSGVLNFKGNVSATDITASSVTIATSPFSSDHAVRADRVITAGNGLSGGGNLLTDITISHADTSSQASVDNSGNTFIQDIALDGFGHVTGISSSTVSVGDGSITISAGTALTGGGSFSVNQSSASTITINHEDTSTQASVNNSNGTVIQDVTLDTYGHVTSLTSYNLDNRYYTESEVDNLLGTKLNLSGGTMSGNLTMGGTLNLDDFAIVNASSIDTGIISIDSNLVHNGDSNTYVGFTNDTISFFTGGNERMKVNNTETQIDNLRVTGYFRIPVI